MHLERFDKVVHALLNEKLPDGISKSMTRKLVMIGAVYVQGRRCRIASKQVHAGNDVRVEYHPDKLLPVHLLYPVVGEAHILYREKGIIVVNKPANLPTVATLDNARDNLVAQLEKLLNGYIGVHHRLDAPTSGCLLFTTEESSNVFAAKLFQENLIQKKYLAIVKGINPKQEQKWEIKNQLARAKKKKNIYASTEGEGSFAHSRFAVLETKGDFSLIEAEPVTGRTHQLRVHLSEYGLPIVGDRAYGGPGAERLMLHAHTLTFRSPATDKEVQIVAPLDQAFKKLFNV